MRTDTQLIERFIQGRLSEHERAAVMGRRVSDPGFRMDLVSQSRLHLAAIMYGRNLRRAAIRSAAEDAFSDRDFREQVDAIFK